MTWFLLLVPISLTGAWVAARHWYGWAISAASEGMWLAYSLHIHSVSLAVMSLIWAVLHIRNTLRTFIDQFEVEWFTL